VPFLEKALRWRDRCKKDAAGRVGENVSPATSTYPEALSLLLRIPVQTAWMWRIWSMRARLGRLREALRGQIAKVEARLAELEPQLQGQGQAKREDMEYEYEYRQRELESGQRELGLVEAAERDLTGQGQGQQDTEGAAPGASKQVRRSDSRQIIIERAWLIWWLRPFYGSLRQLLPSSGRVLRRPMSSRSLSPSLRGPYPRPCGRITCCRC
jgi:hypothetical protein